MKPSRIGLTKAMVSQMAKTDTSKKPNFKTRASHAGKSNKQKQYYTKAIKGLRSEPTVDESLDFSESDNCDVDFTVQEATKRRPVPLFTKVKSHFSDNWIYWFIGFVGSVALPFGYTTLMDSKERILKIETKMDYTQKYIDENKIDLKELGEKLNQNSLQLKEVQLKIDFKKRK